MQFSKEKTFMSATITATPGSAKREPEKNINKTAATADGSQSQASGAAMQEEIARLAYTLWQQRGCPIGSAEFDWFAAEQKLLESMERRGSSNRQS
jgi:hypothetical protein